MSEKMKTIFDLIMRINEETEFAAFMQVNGHVDRMRVSVCKDKERRYNEKVYEAHFYYAGVLKATNRQVEAIVNNLKEFLEVQ